MNLLMRFSAMSDINKEDVFMFLDDLRESGATNMFGAAPYIEEAFDVNRKDARALLLEWMSTYSDRHA
jgi:hypothetical protein